MTFLWPGLLWLLLLVPLLALTAALILRRRGSVSDRFPGLAGSGATMARPSAWRWLPWGLFLVGLAALFIAAARPVAVVMVPRLNQTILLALDSSLSMRAADVKPSRLEAVQSAAHAFVAAQPGDTRIGVISFAATASVVQMPTIQRDDVLAAVDRLSLQRGTAIGSAILVGLGVLFPQEDFERMLTPANRPPSLRQGSGDRSGERSGDSSGEGGRASGDAARTGPRGDAGAAGNRSEPLRSDFSRRERGLRPDPVAPGSYDSAAIVIVTDGQSTVGPAPAEAARLAADFGVRVYTVGVGTPDGEIIEGDGWKVRVRLDESVLKDVATQTQGESFLAESAEKLNRISQSLGTRFVLERKETEISAWFSAVGALLLLAATMLSLRRSNRIV